MLSLSKYTHIFSSFKAKIWMRQISAWLYNNECRGRKVFIESTKSRNNWFQWHLPPKCYDPPPTACPGLSLVSQSEGFIQSAWPIRGRYCDQGCDHCHQSYSAWQERPNKFSKVLEIQWPIRGQRLNALTNKRPSNCQTGSHCRQPHISCLSQPLMRPENPANARNQCFVLTVNSWPSTIQFSPFQPLTLPPSSNLSKAFIIAAEMFWLHLTFPPWPSFGSVQP